MKRISQIAHELSQGVSLHMAIDFTCGNGNDTRYLAEHFMHVHAFDIQKEALYKAKVFCQGHENISFHLCSHERANQFVDAFDFGIFNLGYLPNGDHTITTQGDVVIRTLDKILPLLRGKGRIVLVLYPGFEQGALEAQMVESYVSLLDSRLYECAKFMLLNKKGAPYILMIEKR